METKIFGGCRVKHKQSRIFSEFQDICYHLVKMINTNLWQYLYILCSTYFSTQLVHNGLTMNNKALT